MKVAEILHIRGARLGNQLIILCNALLYSENNNIDLLTFNKGVDIYNTWAYWKGKPLIPTDEKELRIDIFNQNFIVLGKTNHYVENIVKDVFCTWGKSHQRIEKDGKKYQGHEVDIFNNGHIGKVSH